jgi:NAD+ synthase (glutamine-hydrolysing)
MKITLAQLNPTVGDFEGNLTKIRDTLVRSAPDSPDLVVFSELFLTGYPPRDLLERPWFMKQAHQALGSLLTLTREFPDPGILVGTITQEKVKTGKGLFNSALLIRKGKILFCQHKSLLPFYDVFDETRYFDPASRIRVFRFKGEVLGISVCEDAWNDPQLWTGQHYPLDPIAILAKKGATVFINLSASPFFMGKDAIRFRLIQGHSRRHQVPFVYVNQVGANDELIFDGTSLCLDQNGDKIKVFPSFEEKVMTLDLSLPGTSAAYRPKNRIGSLNQALVVGIRDYVEKCGFKQVIISLSGGIDSALTCALAVEALGRENVFSVSMPSPYSSRGSVEDSRALARNLGIPFKVIPISGVYQAYLEALKESFAGREMDLAEENIQARIRGNMVMALSNKFGYLVLSTGNKSEIAVGYCTLYGDMSGGLSVIADVPKTLVYQLAGHINRSCEIIPRAIFEKAPSAELRPDQKDQDTLPPYEILDQILNLYVDEGLSSREIERRGFDPETVRWVLKAVNRNEYKRRQAAPGLKVTSKAFGMGRRMPIAAKYYL